MRPVRYANADEPALPTAQGSGERLGGARDWEGKDDGGGIFLFNCICCFGALVRAAVGDRGPAMDSHEVQLKGKAGSDRSGVACAHSHGPRLLKSKRGRRTSSRGVSFSFLATTSTLPSPPPPFPLPHPSLPRSRPPPTPTLSLMSVNDLTHQMSAAKLGASRRHGRIPSCVEPARAGSTERERA